MKLPKLHLRDLFWLVLVCACLFGWLLSWDRYRVDYNGNLNEVMRAKHHEEELRRAIQAEGFAADWDEGTNSYRLTELP